MDSSLYLNISSKINFLIGFSPKFFSSFKIFKTLFSYSLSLKPHLTPVVLDIVS